MAIIKNAKYNKILLIYLDEKKKQASEKKTLSLVYGDFGVCENEKKIQ